MNKKLRICLLYCGVIVLALVIVIPIGYVVFEHDINNTAIFMEKAKQYLGTDNFTISSWDGFLVATSPDGLQYPEEPVIDMYFYGLLSDRLVLFGAVLSFFIPIVIVFLLWKYWSNKNSQFNTTTN